jgi:hypothetical protein
VAWPGATPWTLPEALIVAICEADDDQVIAPAAIVAPN